MLNIAICDDDEVFIKKFNDLVHRFFENKNIKIKTKLFINGLKLIQTPTNYDVVFLDIDMPEMNGNETANYIKKSYQQTKIIFISAHQHYVFNTIKYQPFRFLRKQKLDSELEEALNAVINDIDKIDSKNVFTFKTKRGEITQFIKEILYIEVYDHKIQVHTIQDSFVAYGITLNEIENKFKDFGYVRPHKSYLVNCKYIYSIDTNQIVLDNKEKVPLSRLKIDEVKKKFQDTLRGV